ncbi:MAG: DUF4442 domain-containing protein [Candidatus Hydrogenedentota bacterium]|nr:MAG: DUF4442 domain-containing protein [Candidatus Hydrogenedentota bacterium]
MKYEVYSLWKFLENSLNWKQTINSYPPYLYSGIEVVSVSPDFRKIEVQLHEHIWNRNYVGVHFGGSLYAMTDPFYMFMLMKYYGPDYIVWDKAASIEFLKPGSGTVSAVFELHDSDIQAIYKKLETKRSCDHTFTADVKNEKGTVCARVQKVLYIRRPKQ